MLKIGRANIIIDGQFGSTGKGMLAGYISDYCTDTQIDYAVTNNAPNAGHTYIVEATGKKIVAKQLPIIGILRSDTQIYLNAGSVISINALLEEMEEYGVDPKRVAVHPRATLLSESDIENERGQNSTVTRLASTQSGVGAAIAGRVMREPYRTAGESHYNQLNTRKMVREVDLRNKTCVVEVPQGVGLGLNSGFAYPHCTGREISVSQAMADCCLHPDYLGTVFLSVRAHPIRVGHIYDDLMKKIGDSGPFWPDSHELTWDELGQEPELTTVTKRVRRIATFSMLQFEHAVALCRPDVVFLNFLNYLDVPEDRATLLRGMTEVCTARKWLLGYGPLSSDVRHADDMEDALI